MCKGTHDTCTCSAQAVSNSQLPGSGVQAAGFRQPAKAMYILPVCDVPHLEATLTPSWQLPGGRHPDQHHVFPLELPVCHLADPHALLDDCPSSYVCGKHRALPREHAGIAVCLSACSSSSGVTQ